MFDTMIKRIEILAAEKGDSVALAFKKDQVTYSQLYSRIVSIGNTLAQMGIAKGDRVMFSALSKPEMVAVYLGIQYAGGIAVFADKNATPENMALIYEDSGAKLLVTDKPMKDCAQRCNIFSLRVLYQSEPESLNTAYEMPGEDEIAELLFTSGTTGKPKGVMLSYKAIYNILSNTIDGIGIYDTDRVLLPLPLNHSFALRVLRAVLYVGGMVVLQNGFTFAKEIENNMNEYHCTAMAAVSASMEMMRSQMQDKFTEVLGQLRYIEISAGSLSINQRKVFTKLLPDTVFHNTWGSSESGGALFLNVNSVVDDPVKVGALGRPLPCVQIKVLDEENNEIKSDAAHPGRMALKGDMQMSGYWERPELNAETLRDGWLLTGDMVYMDEDGYVYMLGRADDLINVGGEKVSPIEVENIAGQYEGLRECACVGVPDPEGVLGQIPALFVVPKTGYAEDELQKFLASKMERYKLPQAFMMLQELPRNAMKKVNRKELKRLWENKDSEDLMNPVMQAIFARRSVRKFTDAPIPKEILEMLVKAGYYAPSGHNMQTWRFTVVNDPELIAQIKEATAETAKRCKTYFYGFENPTALILVSNDDRNRYACQDSSAATQNIMLAAQSYGIGSVWVNALMTLRHEEPAESLLTKLGVPENHTVWSMIAMGYPLSEGAALAKKTEVVNWT